LTRSYESNGPDVKIRGNAHHVAEKYLQLARDAHTGGDPVAAENYLQHAEHYFRLIAAAQAAQAFAQSGQPRPMGEVDGDDLDDDGDFGTLSDRFASPADRSVTNFQQQPQQGFQPQPAGGPQMYSERPAYEGDRQGSGERPGFGNRQQQDRQGNRFPRPDRPFGDRGEGYRDNRHGGRDNRPRDFRPYRDAPNQPANEVAGTDDTAAGGLPSFITASPRPNGGDAPVGEPSRETPPAAPNGTSEVQPAFESHPGENAFPGRGRRRRLRSPYGFGGGNSSGPDDPSPAPEATDD
jgi:hypothetical protein